MDCGIFTTRLQTLCAVLIALAMVLLPAAHAVEAAQPMDCCNPSATPDTASDTASPDQDEVCGCCNPQNEAQTPGHPSGQDQTPDCPSNGDCPCCKNLLVTSPMVPVPAATRIIDLDPVQTQATPVVGRPDSCVVATDARPPIA